MTTVRNNRGFALVLAMFLILILYTSMTVMMASFHTDIALSKQSFESTKARYAAQGAVNKLYTLLRHGQNPEDYPESRPLQVDIGEFKKVKAWVVPGEHPGVFHLYSNWQGATFSRVITQGAGGGARIYVHSDGRLKSAAVASSGWTDLPAPPTRAIDIYTGLEGHAPNLQLSTNEKHLRANANGQVAAYLSEAGSDYRAISLWDEGSKSWSLVPPAPGWQPSGNDIAPGGAADVRANLALGEKKLFAYDNISVTGSAPKSVVSTYDLATKTWTDTKGPSGGTRIENGFPGPNDTFIAEIPSTQAGGPTRLMQLRNNTWAELPPLPGGAVVGRVRASGHEGELFVSSMDGRLHVFKDGGWSPIQAPTLNAQGEPLGQLRSVDAEGALIFANHDTATLSRWTMSSEPTAMPRAGDALGGVAGGGQKDVQKDEVKTTASY